MVCPFMPAPVTSSPAQGFLGQNADLTVWPRSSRGSKQAARVPSLALRLARVASGALDGTFTAPNSHDWDLAAADLLVHEAGGALTTLTGQSLIYNRPNPVHAALLAAGRRVMPFCSVSFAIVLPSSPRMRGNFPPNCQADQRATS